MKIFFIWFKCFRIKWAKNREV